MITSKHAKTWLLLITLFYCHAHVRGVIALLRVTGLNSEEWLLTNSLILLSRAFAETLVASFAFVLVHLELDYHPIQPPASQEATNVSLVCRTLILVGYKHRAKPGTINSSPQHPCCPSLRQIPDQGRSPAHPT